jgi:hypothetical protein
MTISVDAIQSRLDEAQRNYQGAVAMHNLSMVSYHSGQIQALKSVLELLRGIT